MRKPFAVAMILPVFAAACHAGHPAAVTPAQLLTSGTNGFQGFGTSVAMDGETLVIGAPYTDDHITGAAYVYERRGGEWELAQRLFPPQLLPTFGLFGDNVAIHSNTIVIGVGNESGGPTASYVYVHDTDGWVFQQTLPAAGQVAVYGDTIVVGDYAASVPNGATGLDEAGLAFVFVRSNSAWSLQAQLKASDPRRYDHFGTAVAIYGDTIVVGAIGDVETSDESGAAYAFSRQGTNWTQTQKLRAADPQSYADFGGSLALREDCLVVGAPGYLDYYTNSGNAYVFTRSSGVWSQQQKLSPSDPAAKDSFGTSVSCTAQQILVGQLDKFPRENAAPSGAAYVFKPVGGLWEEQGKLDSNAGMRSLFRVTVCSSGDTILVGNPWVIGSASVYERPVLARLHRATPVSSLSFASDPARHYTVQFTDFLQTPVVWPPLTNVIGTGSLLEVPLDTAAACRFYRVLLEQ